MTMINFFLAFALLLPAEIQIANRNQISPGSIARSNAAGFSVIGRLTFEDGAEPAIVDVELRSPDGLNTLEMKQATMEGIFQFDGVGLGRYFVVIESDRYQYVKHLLDVDTRSFSVLNLELSLYPRPTLADGTKLVSIEELRRNIPGEALKKLDEALGEFQDDDAKKGIERLKEAIEIAPDFYEAHLEMGYAHQRERRAEEAIASLEKAYELNPTSAGATTWLGRLYFETENYPAAVERLVQRVDIGNATAADYFILGSSYYRLAQPREAEANLLQAVMVSPEEAAGARLQLFNLYMRTRLPAKALEQVEAYLEEFPGHPNHDAMKERGDQLRKSIPN